MHGIMVTQRREDGHQKMWYPQFSFKRETARDLKIRYQKNFKSQEGVETFTVIQQERPSMVSDELVTEIKVILHNLCVSGEAIIRKTVIANGNGVLSSRFLENLASNGGSVTLNTKLARAILKLLHWMKGSGKTAKGEMKPE